MADKKFKAPVLLSVSPAGAQVILKHNGREVGRATTDTFGEFKIDRLESNSGQYQLEVTGSSGRFTTQCDLANESRYLGVMKLAAVA